MSMLNLNKCLLKIYKNKFILTIISFIPYVFGYILIKLKMLNLEFAMLYGWVIQMVLIFIYFSYVKPQEKNSII